MQKLRGVFIAALALTATVALAADEDRVFGAGHLNFEKVYGDVEGHRIFTVNVRRDESGRVQGHAYDQFKVKDPSVGGFEITIKDHIEINCLFIVGRTAFMSGIIVKEQIEPEEFGPPLVGAPVTFSIVDNDPPRGQRSKTPDLVSFGWVFPKGDPVTCHSQDPRHNLRDPITSGDLKIRLAGD